MTITRIIIRNSHQIANKYTHPSTRDQHITRQNNSVTLVSLGPKENKHIGCPKGTTKQEIHDKCLREKQCLDTITCMYEEKRTSQKNCVPNLWLQGVIDSKKQDYNVTNLFVSYKTIHSRVTRKNLTPTHPGTCSPILSMEPALLEICLAIANIRQPLTSTKGLELANSLIEGKPAQQNLHQFQELCHKPVTGKHGMKYGTKFLKQNESVLTTKFGQRFACDRGNWSKKLWVAQMYNQIYNTF